MASPSPVPAVNGGYGSSHYNAAELPAHNPAAANGAAVHPSAAPSQPSAPASGDGQDSSPSKDEVGWYFVEQYYTTLSKNPEKLPVSPDRAPFSPPRHSSNPDSCSTTRSPSWFLATKPTKLQSPSDSG